MRRRIRAVVPAGCRRSQELLFLPLLIGGSLLWKLVADREDPSWRPWHALIARACTLGICGGDYERNLDLAPARLFAILRAAERVEIERQLAAMASTNRGMVGGSDYDTLQRELLDRHRALSPDPA